MNHEGGSMSHLSSVGNLCLPLVCLALSSSGCGARSDLLIEGAGGATTEPPKTIFQDLGIHRVIVGFSNKSNPGLQRSLVTSTATQGILERLGHPDPEGLKEVFNLTGGISFNAEAGEVLLAQIETPVNPDLNNPVLPSALQGIRLFNAMGSAPGGTEYFVQCQSAPAHDCSFYYWTQGHAEVEGTEGSYDPITGEMTFPDLTVHLHSPDVPALANADIDATIRLSLTTGCVSPDQVPDPAAQAQHLVPQQTLNDMQYDQTLMPENPLAPYVGGKGCASGELHGRPLSQPDETETLDDGDYPNGLPSSFDLAGVGRINWSNNALSGANVYIIIKAGLPVE